MKGLEKIPITVGIIGHRDAKTTQDHKHKIEMMFMDLAAKYPNSPVYLFSSIADGADRFVAKIFLELKKSNEQYNEKFELIVPMPFEYEEYKKDFDDNSDIEFDDLLKQAKRKFSIRYSGKDDDKPRYYLETGRFVADSSLILIALWDGKEGHTGGTSDIVNYKIKGDSSNVAQSTFEYNGSVFVLPCDRKASESKFSDTNNKGPEFSLEFVLKDPTIKEALDKIEEINTSSPKINQTALGRSQDPYISNPGNPVDPQKTVLNLYSILDALAIGFHKRYVRTVIWLFITGLLILMSLGIYTNLWMNKVVLASTVLLIIVAGLIYYNSRISKVHTKYLYNRMLAEALRIQYYWNNTGINYNVSDYILRIHRKEFTWIEHILSSIYGITYNDKPIIYKDFSDLTINWVKNQADFFESSIRKMTKKLGLYHLISNISFIGASVLLLSNFLFEQYYVRVNFMNPLQVFTGTLLSIFALIRAYIQFKGYDQLLKQYELMNVLYQKANAKINEIFSTLKDPEEQRTFLKELFFIIGKEALIENGTWYLILKEKEPGIEGI